MAPINLSKFAWSDDHRAYLREPFTVGDFSYATNGHILVRVPARENIPESGSREMFKTHAAVAKKVDAWLAGAPELLSVGKGLPPMPPRASREFLSDSFQIRGRPFDGKYVRMIAALPGSAIIGDGPDDGSRRGIKCTMVLFAFDGGGFGALMPLSRPFQNHHDTRI